MEDKDAGKEFVDKVKDNLPQELSETQMIRLLGGLIVSYCDGPNDAMRCLATLALAVRGHYVEQAGGECDCPRCKAERGALH